MSLSVTSAAICLIACHGGPADHFAVFAENLTKQGYEVQVFAMEPALKKFEDRGIKVKTILKWDNSKPNECDQLAEQIAKICSKSSVILSDVGHIFDAKIQKAASLYAPETLRLAYYDNPEAYVPGGYSSTAAEVIKESQGVLFANANLAHKPIYSQKGQIIDFGDRKRIGLGYYPVEQANKIAERRKTEHHSMQANFITKYSLDNGKKVIVYFGGNHDEYFSKAFPAFLSFLAMASNQTDLSHLVIVLQQHPGAKADNLDGQQVQAWLNDFNNVKGAPKFFISDLSSDDAQVLADAALYYQTSMGPQFILEGLPTVQVGHEKYDDMLVANHLADSVISGRQLICAFEKLVTGSESTSQKEEMLKVLGIRSDWLQVLQKALKK